MFPQPYGGFSVEDGKEIYKKALRAKEQGVSFRNDLIQAKQIFESCVEEHPQVQKYIDEINQLL